MIPLLTLLGVNHLLPIFHKSKTFVYINNTEKRMNKFEIGYIINPKLDVNKMFREQFDKSIK